MGMKMLSWPSLAAFAVFAALSVLVSGSGPSPAVAQQSRTLHLATLAPRGSKWMRVFDAWNATLKQTTGGRLSLRVDPGGASVNDRDFVRNMKAGKLDGATLATTGLAEAVPQALVFAVPGLPTDPKALDKARSALADTFRSAFEERGYHLIGWVDLGQVRLMSRGRPVKTPSDLGRMKPWARAEDAVFPALLEASGARPVHVPLSQVQSALGSGRVDVVPASPIAAVSTGWYSSVQYMTGQPMWTLVGATVVRKDVYAGLPSDLQQALDSTGAKAHKLLGAVMRSENQNAYQTLLGRGIKPVDLADPAGWKAAFAKTQSRMQKRYFPAALLARVKKAAGAG